MQQNEELTDMIVLVNPRLVNDPDGRKNQVGLVRSADLAKDDIVVGFSDGKQCLFSTDALLVMRNTEEIRGDADFDFNQLFREDYWDIMEVCMLQDMDSKRAAMELVSKSPMVLEYAVQVLEEQLGLSQSKKLSR